MLTAVVIPCRWGSRRLPGKPLVPLAGRPLIQHVYERATGCKKASCVVVATDDPRIEKTVRDFGGEVFLTRSDLRTGSDRVAELVETIKADAYVNLQGDELILDPEILDELIIAFEGVQPFEMGTLKQKITDPKELVDPNVVKVVTNNEGLALYFSRAPIPYIRNDDSAGSLTAPLFRSNTYYKHFGIYIYEREALNLFASRPTGILEDLEKLEQLRAMENGLKIRVWETSHRSLRIDSAKDVGEAERILGKEIQYG